eukprot:9956039-Heterocapsa_arctica.AAC.1
MGVRQQRRVGDSERRRHRAFRTAGHRSSHRRFRRSSGRAHRRGPGEPGHSRVDAAATGEDDRVGHPRRGPRRGGA